MVQTHIMLVYFAFVNISFYIFLYLWLVVAHVQDLS